MAVAALLLPLEAASSQEWEEVAEREARIVFFADAVGLTKDAGLRSDGESPRESYEVGFWSGADATLGVFYAALAGNWTWPKINLDEEDLGEWEFLAGKKLSLEREDEMVNVLGKAIYARFRAEELACFGFVQMFDRIPGGRGTDYRKHITGAFCKQGGGSISTSTIEAVLKNIGIKGFKEPKAAHARAEDDDRRGGADRLGLRYPNRRCDYA